MTDRAILVKRARLIKWGAVVLGVLLAGLSFLWTGGDPQGNPSEIRERARAIADREGIVIGLGSPDTFYVPPYTAGDASLEGGKAEALSGVDTLPPALDGIEEALRAYPPGFFGAHCKAIFLCGSLTLDGASAGGTWKKVWIILAANRTYGKGGIYENAWYGVHHEFSSLIWSRFPEMQDRWRALLPPGWAPAGSNADALKASGDLTVDPKDGFLTPYGATTPENDFNTYAEMVFVKPSHVARQADHYPVVAKKLALLMEAYIQLDKRFEGIFEGRGVLRFRSALPASFGEGVAVSPNVIPKGRIVASP